jgi:arsenite methyltransferase
LSFVERKTMDKDLREKVKERYADVTQVAHEAGEDGRASCGGTDAGALEVDMTGSSYSEAEKRELLQAAVAASLGCGNPVALAELSAGQVALDLGRGGGIDVLLSARRVAPSGKAYGLDMTDEMLALARENQREAGVENVEFLKGE